LRHHSSYRSLTIALDRRLWRDPTHLQPPTGALVLVATKGAGNKLHDLLRDRRSLYQGKLSQLRCTKQANAGHQRRARTDASDKPCMRDTLFARPLHAIVMPLPAGTTNVRLATFKITTHAE